MQFQNAFDQPSITSGPRQTQMVTKVVPVRGMSLSTGPSPAGRYQVPIMPWLTLSPWADQSHGRSHNHGKAHGRFANPMGMALAMTDSLAEPMSAVITFFRVKRILDVVVPLSCPLLLALIEVDKLWVLFIQPSYVGLGFSHRFLWVAPGYSFSE